MNFHADFCGLAEIYHVGIQIPSASNGKANLALQALEYEVRNCRLRHG